jgi:hypothetical protein
VFGVIEPISIAVDQTFGELHDPAYPATAVPMMIVVTAIAATVCWIFYRRVQA